ncbi:MAG: DNA gyrase C-terminal beta-propeller domain-containing protein, partial [Acholeplasmataceae bacterium]
IKIIVVKDFEEDTNLLLATEKGKIKQTALKDFNVSRYSRTIRAMRLLKHDRLTSVEYGTKFNVICFTKRGQALRFRQSDIPVYGTQSSGINALKLREKDELVKAIYAKSSDELLILSSKGNLKRDKVSNYPLNKRLRASVVVWEDRARNPHFIRDVSRLTEEQIKEDVNILITAKKGSILFKVSELKPSVAMYGRSYLSDHKYGKSLFINLDDVLESEDIDLIDEGREIIDAPEKLEKTEEIVTLKRHETEEKPKEDKVKITKLSLFDDDWKES